MIYTLKTFNTGQITLPKAWRSKFKTKHFVAEERPDGLLIKPIESTDDVVYYTSKDGFGLYSDKGIDPADIISQIQKLQHG